ncbi:putative FMRFamide-like neuropeptide [Dirofilaria immitis]
MTSNRTIVANVFIQVLLFMFLVPNVLPLPLIANLPIRDTSLYDDPPLVDYNFVPYSGMRIDDELLIDEQPFQVDKRKNEFIRFGKRNDLMKFNKRKNEFIRFGKRFIKVKTF